MSTAHRIVFAIGALIAIAFVGALIGSHDARSAERDLAGVITFQCTNENDIKLAAHAAERGNTDVLRKLHQSQSCQGRQIPAAPAFFQSENVEWQFSTENVEGVPLVVYKVDLKNGTTWIIALMNPDFAYDI